MHRIAAPNKPLSKSAEEFAKQAKAALYLEKKQQMERTIQANIALALEEKLITQREVDEGETNPNRRLSIRAVFYNEWGIKGLRRKWYTLSDLDPISMETLHHLFSSYGMGYLEHALQLHGNTFNKIVTKAKNPRWLFQAMAHYSNDTDPNWPINPFITPISMGDLNEVRSLIDVNADVNVKRNGDVAIIWAAGRGQTNIVRVLLNAKANVLQRDNKSLSALDVATNPVIKDLLQEAQLIQTSPPTLRNVEKNDPDLQFYLGEQYEKGHDVQTNLKKAFHYYKLAADQGHKKSQIKIALAYQQGNGVEKDTQKADEFYCLAFKDDPLALRDALIHLYPLKIMRTEENTSEDEEIPLVVKWVKKK